MRQVPQADARPGSRSQPGAPGLVALVAAWLLAMGLAGCAAPVEHPEFVTARYVADDAWAEARAWDASAQLVGVAGAEPHDDASASILGLPPWLEPLAARSDPAVGDGRAQAWLFSFISPARPALLHRVLLDASGAALDARDLELEGAVPLLDDERIVDWRIDSSEAARAVREAHPEWLEPLLGRKVTLLHSLDRRGGGDPHWNLRLEPVHGQGWAVFVNAANGSVGEPPWAPTIVPPEEQWTRGRLDAVDAVDVHAFVLRRADHEALRVHFSAERALPLTLVQLELRGPSGSAGRAAFASGLSADGATRIIEVPDPEPGSWTLTVVLRQGVVQDYGIAWCAVGNATAAWTGASDPGGCSGAP